MDAVRFSAYKAISGTGQQLRDLQTALKGNKTVNARVYLPEHPVYAYPGEQDSLQYGVLATQESVAELEGAQENTSAWGELIQRLAGVIQAKILKEVPHAEKLLHGLQQGMPDRDVFDLGGSEFA